MKNLNNEKPSSDLNNIINLRTQMKQLKEDGKFFIECFEDLKNEFKNNSQLINEIEIKNMVVRQNKEKMLQNLKENPGYLKEIDPTFIQPDFINEKEEENNLFYENQIENLNVSYNQLVEKNKNLEHILETLENKKEIEGYNLKIENRKLIFESLIQLSFAKEHTQAPVSKNELLNVNLYKMDKGNEVLFN